MTKSQILKALSRIAPDYYVTPGKEELRNRVTALVSDLGRAILEERHRNAEIKKRTQHTPINTEGADDATKDRNAKIIAKMSAAREALVKERKAQDRVYLKEDYGSEKWLAADEKIRKKEVVYEGWKRQADRIDAFDLHWADFVERGHMESDDVEDKRGEEKVMYI